MAIRTKKEKHITVPESVIQEFRDKGMAASLKKFEEGKGDAAFNEGIKRFYPAAYEANKNKTKVTMQSDIPRSRTRRGEQQAQKTRERDAQGRFTSSAPEAVARNATRTGTKIARSKTAKQKMGPYEKAQTRIDNTQGLSTAAVARRIRNAKPTPKKDMASKAEVKSWGTISAPSSTTKRVPKGTRPGGPPKNPDLPTGFEIAGRWLKKKWTPKKPPRKGVAGSRRMM